MVRWLYPFACVLLLSALTPAQKLEISLEHRAERSPERKLIVPSATRMSAAPPLTQHNGTFYRNLRNLQRGQWCTLKTRGEPNKRHEACYIRAANGKHYLIGGRKVKPVSIFDPSISKWSSAPGPGVEIHHMQCVTTPDGLIWIVSSWTGNFPFEQNHEDIFVYNTNTGEWSRRKGMAEGRRRGGAASVLVGSKIFVMHGNRGGHGPHSQSLGWADVYDIDKDEWKMLPDAPNARDHTGGGLINGEICIAGGRRGDMEDPLLHPVRITDCYNLKQGKWYERALMPKGRAGSAYGTTCDGVLVVAGGEGFGKAFDDVNLFDGVKWRNGPSLVRARHGTGIAVHSCECGLLSIASGSGDQGGGPELKSVETLFPKGTNELCQ